MCNREGSELVDAIMKVVGIKFKGRNGKVTHSQYVRVNLVDFEHPFFSRVWHGVHILDATSPLLTDVARRRIQENGGSWPSEWFDPEVIPGKLEFNDLVVTVAGISNVSAVTVHAYKRYKIGVSSTCVLSATFLKMGTGLHLKHLLTVDHISIHSLALLGCSNRVQLCSLGISK